MMINWQIFFFLIKKGLIFLPSSKFVEVHSAYIKKSFITKTVNFLMFILWIKKFLNRKKEEWAEKSKRVMYLLQRWEETWVIRG